ncbi:MAG: hypothetical protein OEZ34_02735 [Spirochaetia bacterium]|nr:hypothetical protein [Spirochaetia bacterium]
MDPYRGRKKPLEDRFILDLGWIPDGDTEGEFKLVLLKNEKWEDPVKSFRSRQKSVIVDEIEQWLF